jgi:hypothetical protein
VRIGEKVESLVRGNGQTVFARREN